MSQTGEALESPRQLATRLGWPLARVRKLIRTKQLRHVKIGGFISCLAAQWTTS